MALIARSSDEDLTDDEVYVGLLDHGLFAEKLPSYLTTAGLAEAIGTWLDSVIDEPDEKKLKNKLNDRAHDFIRFSVLRDINVPRHFGIPHPEAFALQALAIRKYWPKISKHNYKLKPPVSRLHVRRLSGGRIFELNYKGSRRFELEEEDSKWLAGQTHFVKVDISACYPSIYSHAIPWALHGKTKAKKDSTLLGRAGQPPLEGNLLDITTRNLSDRQTKGILIGPHSSNLVSEIILTRIDDDLRKKGYIRVRRYIDDYEYFASSYADAENFIRDLGLLLRDYELSVNEQKTSISSLPQPLEEQWRRELNRFSFPDDEIEFLTIRSFLDLALELAERYGKASPILYALKMVPTRLNDRAKRMFVQEAINLAILFPYLAQAMGPHVFDKFKHPGIQDQIVDFLNKLIEKARQKIYTDAIAHGLSYALRYNIALKLDQKIFEDIIGIDDCVVNFLLFEYANQQGLSHLRKRLKKRSNALKGGEIPRQDVDRQWLFVYQTWTEAELRGNGQGFLAELKKKKFKFGLTS